MARPKGTTKPDTLMWTSITLGLSKDNHDWYKSLASKGSGAKARMLREAIALYRAQNPES